MKKALIIFLFAAGSLSLLSQPPEGFRYQATVRNEAGKPIISRDVSFHFTILKGDPSGISVYEENHFVTTDSYGTVALIIGGGIDQAGTFSTIDWGSDSYFLNVGLDTLGGLSFTDMGTSQFLSVPYAMHSKTSADAFSGDYNDLVNKPVTDGSETKLQAGDYITINGSGTSSDPYVIHNVSDGSETMISVGPDFTISGDGTISKPYLIQSRKHYIGEHYGGGIVFYVYDNGQHGLIAAENDQDLSVAWNNGNNKYTNTTGDGVGGGEMNTTLIIALQTDDNPVGNFAAKVCADYTVTVNGVTYGDWYLPTRHELNLMFFQKDNIGTFTEGFYWSSTEFSSISSWCQNFSNGIQKNDSKGLSYAVRAIRVF